MNKEEELQRYSHLIEYYKTQLQSIETQFSYIQTTILDYMQAKITIEKISETKKGTDFLVPIGGGTFTYVTAKNTSQILTEVGAGIVIDRTPTEAIEIVQKRIDTLEQSQKNISNMSQQIQKQIYELTGKAEKIINETQ